MGLNDIKSRIAAAEAACGRTPGSVTLIAVSKVQPAERVERVLNAGQRVFGENYVQEAAGKWPAWRETWPGIELHMIGPLQTNKLKAALDLVSATTNGSNSAYTATGEVSGTNYTAGGVSVSRSPS